MAFMVHSVTRDKSYVGQIGRNSNIRSLEHQRYIKTNNQNHLKNKKQVRPHTNNMQHLKTCNKIWRMNCFQDFYIGQYQLQGSLVDDQNTGEINALFAFVHDWNSSYAGTQILRFL